jgi:hypothetical protein
MTLLRPTSQDPNRGTSSVEGWRVGRQARVQSKSPPLIIRRMAAVPPGEAFGRSHEGTSGSVRRRGPRALRSSGSQNVEDVRDWFTSGC